MAFQFARALFSKPPIVVDIDKTKRDQALAMGAGYALDPSDRDTRKALIEETGGLLGAIDLVGQPQTVAFGMGLLRKGGKLVIAGLFGGELIYPLPYFPFKSITVEGSYVGSLEEAREMLALAGSGKIAPIPVEVQPLSSASNALQKLREGSVLGRTVLMP